MGSIVGIPTTRVSDLFIRDQVLSQVQQDQLAIFKTQVQLSTGHRFQVPSQDPVAALNVMSLQSLVERKAQMQANVSTNQSFLSATDTALSQVSSIMADIRGIALTVLGTTATDVQRRAAAEQVGQAISQLLDTGNQTFRGRYLFAGSTTMVEPFVVAADGTVKYCGNELRLSSFGDINLMFDTNVTGSEVFGAVSEAVRGTAVLDPVLTDDTPLADLHDGQGVRLGSIEILVGNNRYVVDLGKASTIGDVAAMISAQTGRAVKARVADRGLVLEASGNLLVREVGAGRTAEDLGIRTATTPGKRLVGQALDPLLKRTTALTNILGTRASSILEQAGEDNDLILEACRNGADLNGVEIRFVDDGSVLSPHGGETVTYDATGSPKTLIVKIADGVSTARDVVAALEKAFSASTMPFTARLDPLDSGKGGQGVVHATPIGQTAGITADGSGHTFDADSGLQIVNGGKTYILDFRDAATIEDVLNKLNSSDAGLLAEINEAGNGINVRSRISGGSFSIGENGGRTATDLGLRTFTTDVALDDLNYGGGVHRTRDVPLATAQCDSAGVNNDLLFSAVNSGSEWEGWTVQFVDDDPDPQNDGLTYDPSQKTLTFEISEGSTTAGQILQMLAGNSAASAAFRATLATTNDPSNDGSGPVAVDSWTTSTAGTAAVDFTITRRDGVQFSIDLSTAKTIGDVLDLINNHPDNCRSGIKVRAQLAAYGNGIELVDDDPAAGTLTISRAPASQAAVDLGLIPQGKESSTAPASSNVGRADVESTNVNSSLVFSAKTPGEWAGDIEVVFRHTGTESVTYDPDNKQLVFTYDAGVTTAARIKQLLEEDPNAGGAFSASYATSDPPSDGSGIFAPTSSSVAMSVVPAQVLTGADVNPLETEGLFTALVNLQRALQSNDLAEAQRSIDLLDRAVNNMNFTRAEVGSRQQSLDALQLRLDDEDVQLQSALSLEYDADLTEVVSQLVSQQAVYEAAMKTMAMIFRMTLLDYL